MSKDYLEAFSRITLHTEYDNDSSYDCLNFEDDCKLVGEALTKLEQIESANLSEALDCLEELRSNLGIIYDDTLNTIEQALLQAEKDKKEIEKLKQENAILHIELDAFKKLAFKKYEVKPNE